MSDIASNNYVQWRMASLHAGALRDAQEGAAPSERLLQQVWLHQRVRRDQLNTLDGTCLHVLHPGFWNHEAGPDFCGAILQFGDALPRSGDVEIDLRAAGWRSHGHDRNPAYQNVILRVVWDADTPVGISPPTIVIKSRLDATLDELRIWLSGEPGPAALLQGKCSAPLSDLSEDSLSEILRQAALVRLQCKASAFAGRARQVGWEQSLWEGLFAALGYKQNVWPMRRVAELLQDLPPCDPDNRLTLLALQARLLGVSGLLPTELTRSQTGADNYLRHVWEHWWREREAFVGFRLPRELWRFSGLRPANHPQRRLALTAHWLATKTLASRLEHWFTSNPRDAHLSSSLLEILRPANDDFWSWHWTLRSARLAKPQPLLGAPRVTDLAMNVILPWFWIRATTGKSDTARQEAERRYFAWPRAEDNAVLRLARQRLLGGAPARSLPTAAMQQGLQQIVRDFCEHSNALCGRCRFPELVREFGGTNNS